MSDNDLSPPDSAAPLAAFASPSWQEQDVILAEMWRQNKTPQDIASVLGRSTGAIMTRAARLGLPRRSAPGRKPGSGGRRIDEIAERQDKIVLTRQQPADAAAETVETIQVSNRICLMCLKSFQSQGRHNRICAPCKGSAEYGAAASIADIHFPL